MLEYDVIRVVADDELGDVEPIAGVRIAPVDRLAERLAAIEAARARANGRGRRVAGTLR